MADIDGIGKRASRAAVGCYRLGAGMHVHSCSIQLNGRCHLIGVGANYGHVGLVRREDIDLTIGSAKVEAIEMGWPVTGMVANTL